MLEPVKDLRRLFIQCGVVDTDVLNDLVEKFEDAFKNEIAKTYYEGRADGHKEGYQSGFEDGETKCIE